MDQTLEAAVVNRAKSVAVNCVTRCGCGRDEIGNTSAILNHWSRRGSNSRSKQAQCVRHKEQRVKSARLDVRAQSRSRDAKPGIYEVRSGDTLTDLSRRYGLPVEQLAEINRLRDPDLIETGAQILVPFPGHVPGEKGQKLAQAPRWEVRVREVRVDTDQAESRAPDALEREALSGAEQSINLSEKRQAMGGVSDSRTLSSKPPQSTSVETGTDRLQRLVTTTPSQGIQLPRTSRRLPPQWASIGLLCLIIASWSLVLQVGGGRIGAAYMSLRLHVSERIFAESKRKAALEAAKKAEAQRMRKWWRTVVDDDRKAAQLAPDAINGAVTSRLPSEPSIGSQAREIEQKRLEEEYTTFMRKIKVKDKDDGLIG